jgi:hypothetical protein
MAKCDLCGASCAAFKLAQLLPSYQSAGVEDICPDCEKWANRLKSDLTAEIAPRMREAIAERKDLPTPAAPPVWWRRFFT